MPLPCQLELLLDRAGEFLQHADFVGRPRARFREHHAQATDDFPLEAQGNVKVGLDARVPHRVDGSPGQAEMRVVDGERLGQRDGVVAEGGTQLMVVDRQRRTKACLKGILIAVASHQGHQGTRGIQCKASKLANVSERLRKVGLDPLKPVNSQGAFERLKDGGQSRLNRQASRSQLVLFGVDQIHS